MKCFLKIALTFVLIFMFSLNVFAFNDMNNHWAKNGVEKLYLKGIVKGMPNGSFNPQNTITVAEFVTMVVRLSNPLIQEARENEHWSVPYFQKALQEKLVLPGEFDGLNRNITRGEIATIIIRATKEATPENLDTNIKNIKDYSKISEKNKENILKAYSMGLIAGYPDGNFMEDKTATRAEAVIMILRMLDKSERIVPNNN